MSTLSTTSLNWLAGEWEKVYGSAVLSGIVGDLAHKERGGYHISRQDQSTSNYSVTRADDKSGNGPNDRASAIDMTMSTNDIIKCHTRLRDFWKNRSSDPRMKYINAWNGWNGNGDAGRYDVVTGTIGTASSDHKWHIHLEVRRKYVNDMNAMKAILSMLKGESVSVFNGTQSNALQGDDEDMALTDADVKKIWDIDYLPSGDPENPTWAAKTLIGYRLNKIDNAVAIVATAVATIQVAVGKDNVDESAIAKTLAADPAFAAALGAAIAAKLPTGVEITPEEMTAAVKSALREGVAK